MGRICVIPILLTEDTLSNPFTIPCADVLSLRVVDAAGEKRVKAAIAQLDEVQKNTNDVQIRVWAGQVRSALVSKLESSAVMSSLMNEATMTLIDMPFSLSANQYDDYHKQFAYFGSIEAIQNANMHAFFQAGLAVDIAGYAIPFFKTAKETGTIAKAIKNLVIDYGKEKLKEGGVDILKYIINEIAYGNQK